MVNNKSNQNSILDVDDSIMYYTINSYKFIFKDTISEDSISNFKYKIGLAGADSVAIISSFMNNNCSNLNGLETSFDKLNKYLRTYFADSSETYVTEMLENAFLEHIKNDEDLAIREDNCADYKKCIKNAQIQAAASAAAGYYYASISILAGPWTALGGYIVTSAYVTVTFLSNKAACCTTSASNNGCCGK
jgi:hypothetical protein